MTSADPVSLPSDDAPILPDWPVAAQLDLGDEDVSNALAQRISDVLETEDTLLLSGALGAGKTHIARALIRRWMGKADEPVPSPTFTLVQTYATKRGDIWHADLYRLSDPQELDELGLDEAFGTDLCLIEWPDRLAPDWPDACLLHLERQPDDTRRAVLLAPEGKAMAARLIEAFAA
ncbi:tRNA (adenosine(37)-N6)-threonylcarbamoyltransferase complex ATPase subunit type 1 TsaE [Gymnodinialimonas hymeniacidonis]|uniref:tRNA (adenosine(37)-N6)-threonylcarbamoyltransferase complex ATPase subunit type 1 TsaE n=1 Tax=Gymnodinialimonas hymeniacidonis TaxID=3126508 RepID=UPI0034C5FC0C